MSRTIVTIRTLVVLCTAGLLVPVAVSAQGTSVKSTPSFTAAEQLESIALQTKTQDSDWIQTAQVLEQAARLRPANDAQAVTDLFVAAGAYKTGGNTISARWAAQDAAKRAYKDGDVYRAAVAYIAAVRLSIELHDPDGAFFNMEHAKRLAGSPRLTAQQKRDIFRQLGYPVDPFCEK